MTKERLLRLFYQMIWIMSVEHKDCKTCTEAEAWAKTEIEKVEGPE